MNLRAANEWLARTKPRQRLVAAVLLILLPGLFLLLECSPVAKASRNARASKRFGEALERAGIQTQPLPSR